MPPDLVEPCIKAGTSEEGCCPACGTPWERVVERINKAASVAGPKSTQKREQGLATAFSGYADGSKAPSFLTTGWRPACTCGGSPVPCTVLDPFAGSGTTLAVAVHLGRSGIGCELNGEYINLAKQRIAAAKAKCPLFQPEETR